MKTSRRNFVRTLFVAASGALAAPRLFADAPAPSALPSDGMNFLVFGDWGRKGMRSQRDVAAQMARAVRTMQARFIVSVGDNFYESGVESVDDPQWQTSFEKVYTDPALQLPWHVILGNHDYKGNCDAQLAYGQQQKRWNMPARYYQQTHQVDAVTKADFFYLDTTPMLQEYWAKGKIGAHVATQDVPKQLDWFKNALATSTAQWKIVLAHHPIYSGGEHGDSVDLIDNVLPLLQEYKVQAWINGHDHDLQHLSVGGLNMFCTGAGSQVRKTKPTPHTDFAKSTPGFAAVSMTANKMTVYLTDHRGAVLHEAIIPARNA